ncbi:MAG: Acetyl-coenzyme A carboxylase carboxyl transferase subunit alpha [Actinobacteria bacterium]|nr:Acetyl-coenzyme A carboxylase carboxyl transferase subunit alpha [Actinomycetota bacterium]
MPLMPGVHLDGMVAKIYKQIRELLSRTSPQKEAWRTVKLARHPKRPQTLDYIEKLFPRFNELKGDRRYGEDPAIVGGFAEFEHRTIMAIGHQKGKDTKDKIFRNFGMPNPEGYRKAVRLMRIAERYGLPIVTFIDTPGAYPGLEAEERGQGEAIAYCLKTMASLNVPTVAVLIGEGGSGGALALGLADRVLMLRNAFYSVISPEGCAAILWKDAKQATLAAEALKLTSEDLFRFRVIDEIIKEPRGGAHKHLDQVVRNLSGALSRHLQELEVLSAAELKKQRFAKYENMGREYINGLEES